MPLVIKNNKAHGIIYVDSYNNSEQKRFRGIEASQAIFIENIMRKIWVNS